MNFRFPMEKPRRKKYLTKKEFKELISKRNERKPLVKEIKLLF